MQNLVLRGPVASFGVAPIVFGEELLGAIGFNRLRTQSGPNLQFIPSTLVSPLISDGTLLPILPPVMTHRYRGIVLSVDHVGDQGQRESRNEFTYEYDAATSFSRRLGVLHIKPQIDLFECPVERDGKRFEPRVLEQKSHQTHVTASLVPVQLGPHRQIWFEHFLSNDVVRHDQLAPFGSEELLRHVSMLFSAGVKLTSLAAVEEVNHQPDDQPNEEPHPRNHRKASHQQHTEDYRKDRNHWPKWNAKPAMPLRLLVPQHNDAKQNQHKREQRPNVRHRSKRSDIKQSRWNRYQHAGDPGCERRSPKPWMNPAEDIRQQPVTRHRKPDSRLPKLKHQDRRDHSHDGADQNRQLPPMQPASTGLERHPLESIHDRGGIVGHRQPGHQPS